MNTALRRLAASVMAVVLLGTAFPVEAAMHVQAVRVRGGSAAVKPVPAVAASHRAVQGGLLALKQPSLSPSASVLSPAGLASAAADQRPDAPDAAPAETPTETPSASLTGSGKAREFFNRRVVRSAIDGLTRLSRSPVPASAAEAFDGSAPATTAAADTAASDVSAAPVLEKASKPAKSSARANLDEFGGPIARPEETSSVTFGVKWGLNLIGVGMILDSLLKPLIDAVPWPHFLSDASLEGFGRAPLMISMGAQKISEAIQANAAAFFGWTLPGSVVTEEFWYRGGVLLLGGLALPLYRKLVQATGVDAEKPGRFARMAFPLLAASGAVSFAAAHFGQWGVDPYVFFINLALGVVLARVAYAGRSLKAPRLAHAALGGFLLYPFVTAGAAGLGAAYAGGVALTIPLLLKAAVLLLGGGTVLYNLRRFPRVAPGVSWIGRRLYAVTGALMAPVIAHFVYNAGRLGGELFSPAGAAQYGLALGLVGAVSLFYSYRSALKDAALRAARNAGAAAALVAAAVGIGITPLSKPLVDQTTAMLYQHGHGHEEQAAQQGPQGVPAEVLEKIKQAMGAAPVEDQRLEDLVAKTAPMVHRVITDSGSGSGAVVKLEGLPNGVMFTNAHVVGATKAGETVMVQLMGVGRPLRVKVLAVNHDKDIAFLQLPELPDGKPWPELKLATTMPRVGSRTYAIGYPFNRPQTVTAGIVSGIGGQRTNGYVAYVQTDASVNPGNSGGPLFNMQGEILGINSWGATPSGASHGVNFAITAPFVALSAKQLADTKNIATAALGIIVDLTNRHSTKNGLEIEYVKPGSAAAKAGLRRGDVIQSVNDNSIGEPDDNPLQPGRPGPKWNMVAGMLAQLKPGDKAAIRVLREGQPKVIEVTLDAKVSEPGR